MTDAELVAGLYAVLEGTGEHADHDRRQVGRCVFCSCGARVQGRMPAADVARPTGWQVRLADGFVAYRGSREQATAVAGRHEGATVEKAR